MKQHLPRLPLQERKAASAELALCWVRERRPHLSKGELGKMPMEQGLQTGASSLKAAQLYTQLLCLTPNRLSIFLSPPTFSLSEQVVISQTLDILSAV